MAQTYTDWELVISDDENGDGESWQWLVKLAKADNRVIIVKNEQSRHGQIWNVNNALRHCSGDWIKPLFDDDGMLPKCLETFVAIATKHPELAMIGARAESWRNGVKVGDEADFTQSEIELIPDGLEARKAMCLYDTWNGRTPTHVMIRGDVVRRGAVMVEDDEFKHPLDVRWFGRILEHGGMGFSNQVLVQERQGETASGTSELWTQEGFLTEELRRVYREIYMRAKEREDISNWPSLKAIDAQICGVRGLYHLTKKQIPWAIKYLSRLMIMPTAWPLVLRWLKAKCKPGFYTATERIKG